MTNQSNPCSWPRWLDERMDFADCIIGFELFVTESCGSIQRYLAGKSNGSQHPTLYAHLESYSDHGGNIFRARIEHSAHSDEEIQKAVANAFALNGVRTASTKHLDGDYLYIAAFQACQRAEAVIWLDSVRPSYKLEVNSLLASLDRYRNDLLSSKRKRC